jgi:hypothetical protein
MQESQSGGDRAVARSDAEDTVAPTNDRQQKDDRLPCSYTQAGTHDHLSTSASPVIIEEARAFGFTDYRSRSADKPVTCPPIMTLNQMTRPSQSVLPTYHWNSSPVQQTMWNWSPNVAVCLLQVIHNREVVACSFY